MTIESDTGCLATALCPEVEITLWYTHCVYSSWFISFVFNMADQTEPLESHEYSQG
jgi:hypothetical protein